MGTTLYDIENYFPYEHDDSDTDYYDSDIDIDIDYENIVNRTRERTGLLRFFDREYLSFPEVTSVIFTSTDRKCTDALLLKLLYSTVHESIKCDFYPNYSYSTKIPEMYNNIGKNLGVLLVVEVDYGIDWQHIKTVVDILPNVEKITAIINESEYSYSKLCPELVNIPDLTIYIRVGTLGDLKHPDVIDGTASLWFQEWDLSRNTTVKTILSTLETKCEGKSPEFILGLYNAMATRLTRCKITFSDRLDAGFDYQGGILHFQNTCPHNTPTLKSPDHIMVELFGEFNINNTIQNARDVYRLGTMLSVLGTYKAKQADMTRPFYIFTSDFLKSKLCLDTFK
ncbi:hypothetical protein [Salmon gill poxvirus]|uniref:Uncharacterized protein n=1 Tax=Salmon gill poxvirus TaxID=1680908 RepID=A0A0H4YFT6_9POXV|nr:hypothetical protein AL387_gp205 [Salmon gill poxvirus]AKR04329.1 hypothetical protein SGPV205 [Salmon gill poxvirus]